ncbi:MAG: DegV family protein, partial [Eubacterium sp.]
MSFEIVTDSSCNLTEEIIDRYHLHILSLRFLVGEQEYYSYTKGEITDLAQF